MNFYSQLLIVLLLATLFVFIAKILHLKGILEKIKMGMYGPFVMFKTTMGRNLIEKLSKPGKLWLVFANIGLVLLVISSILMLAMIVLSATIAFNPNVQTPSLTEILVIPGVNPMIPLWYGLIGLIVAVFIHEFSHGILSRVGNIKIRSLGILLIVIPVGAFVEPDQEDMMLTTRKKRANVYAAGPASNLIFGIICAIIFTSVFMGSVEPVEDGVIMHLGKDSPAADSGMESKMLLVDINGTRIESIDDLHDYNTSIPNEMVPVGIKIEGKYRTYQVRYGVSIAAVVLDTPAWDAGLRINWIIESVNDTVVRGSYHFQEIMERTRPNQTINASFLIPQHVRFGPERDEWRYLRDQEGRLMYFRQVYVQNITLGKKTIYDEKNETNKQIGYFGIYSTPMGIQSVFSARSFAKFMSAPVRSAGTPGGAVGNIIYFGFMIPIEHVYLPIQSPISDLYTVTGPLGVLPETLFWFLANIFFYMFWLNLLLGTFNALPAFPLDGGFIFKDIVDYGLFKGLKMKRRKREKWVFYIFVGVSIMIGFLIFWTLIAPLLARMIL